MRQTTLGGARQVVRARERELARALVRAHERAEDHLHGAPIAQDRIDAAADAHVGQAREHELHGDAVCGLGRSGFRSQLEQREHDGRPARPANRLEVAQQLQSVQRRARVETGQRA